MVFALGDTDTFSRSDRKAPPMSELLDDVLATVRERVTPNPDERERLEHLAQSLVDRTHTIVSDLPVDAEVIRVGSSARDTWLRGDRDIDIFIRFDPSISRSDLEHYGLTVGKEAFPDGWMEYAEHPYVRAEIDGYDIDLVPCFAVESASDIRSAVDRTPFHAQYIESKLTDELATEVRVLKRFCESIGVYGSNLKTEGFSGYLAELLILEHGGFPDVVSAASTWQPPVTFDPESHGSATFDDPLVMIDPTDPTRNVAAVVTPETVARFQHYCRQFLETPALRYFDTPSREALQSDQLSAYIDDRETTPVAIRVPIEPLVDDQLYPQLRTSMQGITATLERYGFEVIRSGAFAVDHALFYLEVTTPVLPAVERHQGPPVHVQSHAEAFFEQWDGTDAYGPFIEDDRYVVERYRTVRTIKALFQNGHLDEMKLGRDIRSALETEFDLLIGDTVVELLPEFGKALGSYYDPRP